MGAFIIQVLYERADGALIEKYIIRSKVTGLAHTTILTTLAEAEYWCHVFNQAADDDKKGQT